MNCRCCFQFSPLHPLGLMQQATPPKGVAIAPPQVREQATPPKVWL